MDISSFVLLSHEQALRRRLDVAANNMANSNTPGFRRERPVFREYVEQMEGGGTQGAMPARSRSVAFVQDYRAMQDDRQGAFQTTGNPLDIMIDGPGWLAVEAPGGGGATAYTRAGFLRVNDAGELTTSTGARVLDEGGQPIAVPPEALPTLSIGADGTLSSQTGPLARIGVTLFDDEGAMTPRGDGLADGAGGRVLSAAETHIRTGGVEQSNVNPIAETTELVDILRSFQSSMRMADALNDLRRNAISRLGKIS